MDGKISIRNAVSVLITKGVGCHQRIIDGTEVQSVEQIVTNRNSDSALAAVTDYLALLRQELLVAEDRFA